MRFFAFSLLLALTLWQCNNTTNADSEQATAETTTPATETPPPAAAPATSTQPYPSITNERMKYLWDNCDYVDFVLYATNFSMSQKEQAAIRSTLAGISTTPAQVFPECKPVGRVFFQVDGQNAAEADLFFGGNCLYYLFLEDSRYVAGNQLTQQGVDFYQQIFTQVTGG